MVFAGQLNKDHAVGKFEIDIRSERFVTMRHHIGLARCHSTAGPPRNGTRKVRQLRYESPLFSWLFQNKKESAVSHRLAQGWRP